MFKCLDFLVPLTTSLITGAIFETGTSCSWDDKFNQKVEELFLQKLVQVHRSTTYAGGQQLYSMEPPCLETSFL